MRARKLLFRHATVLCRCALALATLSSCAEGTRPEPSTPAVAIPARAPSPAGIRRTLLGRTAAHEPGWETRLYLVEYPPGAAAPAHVHPAAGVGWVLEGKFQSRFGDDPPVEVRAGQSFFDPADVPHRLFRNPSADRALRFVIAYTIRTGDENFRPLP